MKICGTIQKFRNQIFCIDKFRNRNYNKRVRKITIQKPVGACPSQTRWSPEGNPGYKISQNETAHAGRAFTRRKIGRYEMKATTTVWLPPAWAYQAQRICWLAHHKRSAKIGRSVMTARKDEQYVSEKDRPLPLQPSNRVKVYIIYPHKYMILLFTSFVKFPYKKVWKGVLKCVTTACL